MSSLLSNLAEHAAINLPHTSDRLRGVYEVLSHLDLSSPALYIAFLCLLPYTWFFLEVLFEGRDERLRLQNRPDPLMAYILWTEERLMQAWKLHFVTQTVWILHALFVQPGGKGQGSWGLFLLDLLLENIIIAAFCLLTMLMICLVALWFVVKYELIDWI